MPIDPPLPLVDPVEFPEFTRVLARWREKVILTPTEFGALAAELKFRAGRLAGVWEKQFVEDVYGSIASAWSSGTTFGEWMQGAQKLLDGYGGKVSVYSAGQRWAPWYADLVFRNASASHVQAGFYAGAFAPERRVRNPFWMFNAINDARVRPEHLALDGKVFRKDDPSARRLLPPLGHNCRCGIIELDDKDVADGGFKVSSGSEFKSPDDSWGADKVESLVPAVLKAKAAPPKTTKPKLSAEEKAAKKAAADAAGTIAPEYLAWVRGEIASGRAKAFRG